MASLIAATLALVLSSGTESVIDTDYGDIVYLPSTPEECAEYVVHYHGTKEDTHVLVTDLKTFKIVLSAELPYVDLQWRDGKWQKPTKDCGDRGDPIS